MASARIVAPELLDELHPDDPRARRSRRDLRRVHRAMGSLSILRQAIARLQLMTPPRRILELGAGDGSLLLRLARAQPAWRRLEVTLLDRHDLLGAETRKSYDQLGWKLTVLRRDVIEWVRQEPAQRFDLCITTLFLHHFDTATLGILMAAIAANCGAFVACEPRRSGVAWLGSRLIGIVGANAVTRADAVKSVEAGFAGQELTAIWPDSHGQWRCEEYEAPPFTHCFTAARRGVCA